RVALLRWPNIEPLSLALQTRR
ncbi:hypothetical protein JCM10207_002538, partial [Rhodosporidiobolus poonsookiae]